MASSSAAAAGFAPPLPPAVVQHQGQVAGVVSRSIANIVDFVVLLIFLGGVYLGACGVRLVIHPTSFQFPTSPRLVSLAVAFGSAVVYLTLSWWLFNATLGDSLMALRLTRSGNRKPGLLRSFARAALYVVFPIGFFWCLVSRDNRSIQDVLLRTRVVYDWHS